MPNTIPMRLRPFFAALLLAAACATRPAAPPPADLARAHAHNDYEHARPLLDALEHGFASIEADVYLVNGALLVAHARDSVSADRTLERLYLAPLREAVRHSGGRLRPDGAPLELLIDIKSDSAATYAALDPLLRRYADIFVSFDGDRATTRPIVAVLSGNRPIAEVRAARTRIVALDGRLTDLTDPAAPSASVMPLVSDSWDHVTKWRGDGPPPPNVGPAIADAVARAHAQGRRLRFWGSPDNLAVWTLQYDAGVDLLNADDLSGLRAFLVQRSGVGR